MLFPRLKGVFGNTHYGPEWDKKWAGEQRICSDDYFNRYFSYSVAAGDVSDVEVVRLLETLSRMSAAETNGFLKALAERDATPKLITKLRRRQEDIDSAAARNLTLAIVRNGELLLREKTLLQSTFREAGILVAQLLRRVAVGQERETLACEIIAEVRPISLGVEYLRWIRPGEHEPETDRIVAKELEQQLAANLAERIRAQADKAPLYQTYGEDAPTLYWFWRKFGDSRIVEEHLRRRFESNLDEVGNFLESFVGYAWDMETGLRHRSDFRRESYEAVAGLIDPDFVADNLKRRYGTDLVAPEFYQDRDMPLARRIAHQFTYIHLKVREEKTEKTAGSGGETET